MPGASSLDTARRAAAGPQADHWRNRDACAEADVASLAQSLLDAAPIELRHATDEHLGIIGHAMTLVATPGARVRRTDSNDRSRKSPASLTKWNYPTRTSSPRWRTSQAISISPQRIFAPSIT